MTYITQMGETERERQRKKTLKFLMQQIKKLAHTKHNSHPPNFNLYTTVKYL
jgi:hypothetical protein